MGRQTIPLIVGLLSAAALLPKAQSQVKLGAPTYFIAGRAEYRDSGEIWLRGTSNLPPGSVLTVDVMNYVGENGEELGVRSLPEIKKDGSFQAAIVPLPHKVFKPNIVCMVSFSPNFPRQSRSVIDAVGQNGQRLDFPANPQAMIMSGNRVYLESDLHVD